MIDKLFEQLKRHEGLRLKPYRCSAGKLTIGYGRNLDDAGISESEAVWMLGNDVQKVRQALSGLQWFLSLDPVRQNVCINMAFNLGVARFLGFKNTIAGIVDKDYHRAADEMLNSRWAKQVGKRAEELAEQMRRGEYE